MSSDVDDILDMYAPASGESPPWLVPGYRAPKPAEYPKADIEGTLKELQAPKNEISKGEASLRGAYAAVPFMDEAVGAVKSLASTKDIRQLPENYRRERGAERDRTEMASIAHPVPFYGSTALAMGATAFLPTRGANAVDDAATVGKAIISGAKVGGARGAIDAAGRSEADLTKGEIKPFLVDTAIGGATGALVGGTLKGVNRWVTKGAEERASKGLIEEATAGADSTHSRRLAGKQGEVAEPVVAFIKRNKSVGKALGNPKAVAEETEKIASHAGAQTGPIYQKLDTDAGEVPVKDLTNYLDDEIARLGKDYGKNGALVDAMKSAREDIVKTAQARGAELTGGGTKLLDQYGKALPTAQASLGDGVTMSHQDLRSWVTKLLKEEQKTMGGLAETTKYEVMDKLHETGDKFLKGRLAGYAAKSPALAKDVAKLSALNTDISMALRMNQAATNAEARAYYTKGNQLMGALASGAAGQVLGSGGGVGAAASTYAATVAAPKAIKATGRAVNKAVALLMRKAREGSVTAQVLREAVEHGVPVAVARGVAALAQKQLGHKKDKPQTVDHDDLDWGSDETGPVDWGSDQ